MAEADANALIKLATSHKRFFGNGPDDQEAMIEVFKIEGQISAIATKDLGFNCSQV